MFKGVECRRIVSRRSAITDARDMVALVCVMIDGALAIDGVAIVDDGGVRKLCGVAVVRTDTCATSSLA